MEKDSTTKILEDVFIFLIEKYHGVQKDEVFILNKKWKVAEIQVMSLQGVFIPLLIGLWGNEQENILSCWEYELGRPPRHPKLIFRIESGNWAGTKDPIILLDSSLRVNLLSKNEVERLKEHTEILIILGKDILPHFFDF